MNETSSQFSYTCLVIDNMRAICIDPEGNVAELVMEDGYSIHSRDGWHRMGVNADDIEVAHDAANPQDEEFSYHSDWRPCETPDQLWHGQHGHGRPRSPNP